MAVTVEKRTVSLSGRTVPVPEVSAVGNSSNGGDRMSYGYVGRVLRVDLTSRTLALEQPGDLIWRQYPGGSSLALHYLMSELSPGVDPLGPENILVFATGVLTGCPVPGTSRFTVAAKSPLTGAYGESEAGGWWGPELKFAGFDAVVVQGASSTPVYLWIRDGQAELRDASGLWELGTLDTQARIQAELGDERIRVATIGPGGEKLVRYACILNNVKHANGRTGMGAVMGSKNLKAIAVRGIRRDIPLFDKRGVLDVARSFNTRWQTNPNCVQWNQIGTSRGVLTLNSTGLLPTRNFREGQFEGAEDISGPRMRDTILQKSEGCFACPVKCKKAVRVTGRYEVDPAYGGPEYETIAALGSACGVRDLEAIAKGNEWCNKYGIDTISTGLAIAFAMECFEDGILTMDDTDGVELRFGNADAMLAMVEAICERRGLGKLLGEGALAAAKVIGRGAERLVMHVKGQELGMHEPRGKVGLGLAYAVSPTGPDHMEIAHDPVFQAPGFGLNSVAPLGILESLSPLDLGPRKVRMVAYLQLLRQLDNILGICDFAGPALGSLTVTDTVELVRAATGWDTSLWELLKASERALTMARLLNLREGFGREHDTLPERLFEPMPGGPSKGQRIDPDVLDRAISTYYAMMGWDPETGVPTQEKLSELELK
ncbi:MAG: aldehyde ferredoxin oxidoreductase family protein [Firmicutes bacterium]|jgi:aldehyde:ferredoxin oxidoreductase|nr:aldehyde ferredoxin oxidoreductase family protein [Bacillota bacterium]